MYNLPLDLDQLSKHIVVDMSQYDTEIFKDNKAILIYLRNIDFKPELVDLSFQNSDYSFKEKFFLDYITININVEIKELDQTLIRLLAKFLKSNCNYKSIFTMMKNNSFSINFNIFLKNFA